MIASELVAFQSHCTGRVRLAFRDWYGACFQALTRHNGHNLYQAKRIEQPTLCGHSHPPLGPPVHHHLSTNNTTTITTSTTITTAAKERMCLIQVHLRWCFLHHLRLLEKSVPLNSLWRENLHELSEYIVAFLIERTTH